MLPQWLSSKESACNAGDSGLIPRWGRFPGGGHGNPLQFSCLGISWTEEPGGLHTVNGIAKSLILKQLSMHRLHITVSGTEKHSASIYWLNKLIKIKSMYDKYIFQFICVCVYLWVTFDNLIFEIWKCVLKWQVLCSFFFLWIYLVCFKLLWGNLFFYSTYKPHSDEHSWIYLFLKTTDLQMSLNLIQNLGVLKST